MIAEAGHSGFKPRMRYVETLTGYRWRCFGLEFSRYAETAEKAYERWYAAVRRAYG